MTNSFLSESGSKSALFICLVILLLAGSCFYPKWKKSGTEATISWDVSGYYLYLPAIFIYDDIKQLSFRDEMLKNYAPTPDFQQAYRYENGNYIIKYTIGQAIQMSPFFFIGHLYATLDSVYPADGFSRPYQLSIYFGGYLMAIIGLFYLRKILLQYFSDAATAWTLLTIVCSSNYLEYGGITNAMTHNNLFTLYALLIFNTIQFYKKFHWKNLIAIAVTIGLMALTRPTEIISVIIPLGWGLKNVNASEIKAKFNLFYNERKKLSTAILIIGFVGLIQLFYWQYVAGKPFVYSYEDQGFSWLSPHIIDGLFSYKSGWLIYSPVFFLLMPGLYVLHKMQRDLFWPILIFLCVFIYVAFAWDIWWYGGSLGQRTMVQTYPVIAFPLAALLEKIFLKNICKWLFIVLFFILSYYNFWLVYQAHGGGLLKVSQMTKAYFWEVVGRYEVDEEKLKLLDNKDYYDDSPVSSYILYFNDFENQENSCSEDPLDGNESLCLAGGGNHFSPEFRILGNENFSDWIRASAIFKVTNKEWDVWKMPQFILKFYNNGKEIKSNAIRISRLLDSGEMREIYLDAKVPQKKFDQLGIFFWNPGSAQETIIDNLKIETF